MSNGDEFSEAEVPEPEIVEDISEPIESANEPAFEPEQTIAADEAITFETSETLEEAFKNSMEEAATVPDLKPDIKLSQDDALEHRSGEGTITIDPPTSAETGSSIKSPSQVLPTGVGGEPEPVMGDLSALAGEPKDDPDRPSGSEMDPDPVDAQDDSDADLPADSGDDTEKIDTVPLPESPTLTSVDASGEMDPDPVDAGLPGDVTITRESDYVEAASKESLSDASDDRKDKREEKKEKRQEKKEERKENRQAEMEATQKSTETREPIGTSLTPETPVEGIADQDPIPYSGTAEGPDRPAGGSVSDDPAKPIEPELPAGSPAPTSDIGERTTGTASVEEQIDTVQPMETVSAAVSETSENMDLITDLDDTREITDQSEEGSGDIAMSEEEFAEFKERLEEVMAENPHGDVMASLFYIFKASVEEVNEDKRYFLTKLADMNKIAEAQGEYLKELNAISIQLEDSISGGESGSDSEEFYEDSKYSPDWSDDYKKLNITVSEMVADLPAESVQIAETATKKVWDQAVPIQKDLNIYELTQNIIQSETQDLSPGDEQEVTAVVLARTGNNVRTTVAELQKDNEGKSDSEKIEKWSVLLDFGSVEGETEKELLDNAFENFDQKANQLFTALASVLKAIKEMQSSVNRNLL
jgi:hypothetical protein